MIRFETFATLPPLSPQQLEAQALYILQNNLIPQIEFAENPTSADMFWRMFPIQPARIQSDGSPAPTTASHLINVLETCARRHPYAYVKLSAYNPRTSQTQLAFIAKTPQEGM